MAAPKPTLVLLAGACHVSSCLSKLISELENQGFPTRVATLASVDNANATIEDDVALIRNELLEPFFAEGKYVVLVLHSYASIPGGAALIGQSKKDRQTRSLPGGVVGMIFMCAIMIPEGHTVLEMLGGEYAPWQLPNEETGLLTVTDAKTYFYADLPAPLADESAAGLKGQSLKSMVSPAPAVGYTDDAFDGRGAYIRTLKDVGLPPSAQDGMMQGTGVRWVVRDIETGHSPFLSRPGELGRILGELAGGFVDDME